MALIKTVLTGRSCEEVIVFEDLQKDMRLKYFRQNEGDRSRVQDRVQPQIGPDQDQDRGHHQDLDPDQGLGLDPNRCLTGPDLEWGQGKEQPQPMLSQEKCTREDQVQGTVLQGIFWYCSVRLSNKIFTSFEVAHPVYT